MKQVFWRSAILAFLFTLSNCGFPETESALTTKDSPTTMVASINHFASDLYKQVIREDGDKNTFLSPFSVSSALTMTYTGAKGKTASEMAKTLRLSGEKSQTNIGYQRLLKSLSYTKERDGLQLSIANRIWGQKSFAFLPTFLNETKTFYLAPLGTVDFLHQAEAARQEINTWVSERTEDKIKDLLPKESVSSSTRLVLTNAVYFLAQWQHKFVKESTRQDDFSVSTSTKIKTDFMHQKSWFNYADADDMQILSLPYKDKAEHSRGKASMVIFLPKEGRDLKTFDNNVSATNLEKWLGLVASTQKVLKVNLTLPKWKVTAAYELNETLKTMGMRSAFDADEADFTGMFDKKKSDNLCISKVIHKTFVDVSEQGTEAAGATAVVIVARSTAINQGQNEVVFNANRPFAYLIKDDVTDSILFMGRVVNPSAN